MWIHVSTSLQAYSSPNSAGLRSILEAGLRHVTSSTSLERREADPVVDANILPYTFGLTGVNLHMDEKLIQGLWVAILIVIVVILTLRGWQLFHSHIRHIYCLTANSRQQTYWSFDKTLFWPWLKRVWLYAPIGKKRHNREIQLSSAINYGTLPGRLDAVFLVAYVISNLVFCCLLDFKNSNKAAIFAELRGRTGVLATVNMIPLMVLACRNNPAIQMLKISFDTFNLFHRWIGRIVVVEAAVHVLAWYVNYAQAKGHDATAKSFAGDPFLQYGLVAMVAMAIILIQSVSVIRHAFYEIFLHIHQVLAFFTILGVYVHLDIAKLPARPYIRCVLGLWIAERVLRAARLLYLNFSYRGGSTTVTVEALAGEACRVTFQLPRPVIIRPGSHVYAYIPKLSLWMSHPFSVAWTNLESEPPTGLEYAPSGRRVSSQSDSIDSLEKQYDETIYYPSRAPTSVSLIVAARTGMTRKMYAAAMSTPNHKIQMAGYLEGPYAGHDSLSSYGTVIMFAGGAGITHHLVQIRHLLACAAANTVATRKIILVWSVRDVDALTWIRPWMDEILRMTGRRDILKIMLFVTKPRNQTDYRSPSNSIQLQPGRCSPAVLLDQELPYRIGATMVTVCGPGAFADEVRAAVRERMHMACIDMNEESFTW